MALLDAVNRSRTLAQFMRDEPGPCSYSKPELSAAVDAVDQWVEDNTVSFNSALPVGFRTKATTGQKAFLLCYVLMRRVGKLRAQEDG